MALTYIMAFVYILVASMSDDASTDFTVLFNSYWEIAAMTAVLALVQCLWPQTLCQGAYRRLCCRFVIAAFLSRDTETSRA